MRFRISESAQRYCAGALSLPEFDAIPDEEDYWREVKRLAPISNKVWYAPRDADGRIDLPQRLWEEIIDILSGAANLQDRPEFSPD